MKKSVWMMCAGLITAAMMQVSCGGTSENAEINQLKDETIAVHDEIMPQISSFDRKAIKIDSVLLNLDSLHEANESLDTATLRSELVQLKSKLEGATDQMMQWMMEFDSEHPDKTEEEIKAYYQSELEKVKQMKALFEEVNKESAEKLANF
ncbi:MAG TPA: transposase [Sphingobacteriaceae bacterium]|nr:transposase [Sphingobacteriaceae bacterium]